jgi:hypothetical protein
VFLNTLRAFLDAPLRLLLLAFTLLIFYGLASQADPMKGSLGLGPEGQTRLVAGMASLGNKALAALVWLLGYGLISREASRGSIQLVLLRPLSRASYVLSKWAALMTLAGGATLAVHAIFLMHGWLPLLGLGQWSALLGAQVLQVAALAAVLTLLSSVPVAFGEVGLLLLGWLGCMIVGHYGDKLSWAWLTGLGDLGQRVLLPEIPTGGLGQVLQGTAQTDLAASLPLNLAVLVLALAGAMALMKRREFTYADEG